METEEREPNQGMTAPINEAETERALKGMKSGKAVGSDEILAEVWKCLGWFGVVTLCKLFNSIIITETIPSAWRDSVLVPIFKEKGDIQECNNYRGINLLTHIFKIWERVLDRRVRECTDIHESQFGFMPGRSTTDAIFILKQTIEQYREGQKDICVTFIDLEKAYDRVPRSGEPRGRGWYQKNMSSWSKTCTLDAERTCAQQREKEPNSMLRLAYTRDLP